MTNHLHTWWYNMSTLRVISISINAYTKDSNKLIKLHTTLNVTFVLPLYTRSGENLHLLFLQYLRMTRDYVRQGALDAFLERHKQTQISPQTQMGKYLNECMLNNRICSCSILNKR